MTPTTHVVVSAAASLALYSWTNSWEAAAGCFISGTLIDLDHVLDYYLHHKEIPTGYRQLYDFGAYDKEAKLYLFFHAYEYLILYWLAIHYFHLGGFWIGAALGLTLHLICDQIGNPLKPLSYFISFRIQQSFDKLKIFRQDYIKKHFKIITAAFLLQALMVTAGLAAETMTYAIKKAGIKVGDASLVFNGPIKKDGRDFVLITFTAEAFKFFDEEKIYLDPKTLFPVAVERDLNIFGKKEKISEQYLPEEGLVKVHKIVGKKTEDLTVEKKGQLDNIYAFMYRLRREGDLKEGTELKFNLPTKDIVVKADKIVKFKLAGKDIDALYMESVPSEYRLWFDLSPQRIPLRIDGAMGLAKTSMILTSYRK